MDVFMQMMNYVAKRPYESPQVDAVSVALEGFIALSVEAGYTIESDTVDGLMDIGYYQDNDGNTDIW